jgi:hypothetical protein
VVAAVFEASLSLEQAERLAELMKDGKASRPAGVLNATLLHDDGKASLVAVWRDRETLDRYLSVTEVPRGTELMRAVGAEPTLRIVPVLEFG